MSDDPDIPPALRAELDRRYANRASSKLLTPGQVKSRLARHRQSWVDAAGRTKKVAGAKRRRAAKK